LHDGMQPIGLRYFNVFGPRQDPKGAYAAVVPQWFMSMVDGDPIFINGDGETTRDFIYIEDVIQANIRAALIDSPDAVNQVYNVALGESTTLNSLFHTIRDQVVRHMPERADVTPTFREFRTGDVRHSRADISKAKQLLQFKPTHSLAQGLALTADYFYTMR